MAFRGTDPESYITEYTLVYEDNRGFTFDLRRSTLGFCLGGQRSRSFRISVGTTLCFYGSLTTGSWSVDIHIWVVHAIH